MLIDIAGKKTRVLTGAPSKSIPVVGIRPIQVDFLDASSRVPAFASAIPVACFRGQEKSPGLKLGGGHQRRQTRVLRFTCFGRQYPRLS
jgi:hypothetical protein